MGNRQIPSTQLFLLLLHLLAGSHALNTPRRHFLTTAVGAAAWPSSAAGKEKKAPAGFKLSRREVAFKLDSIPVFYVAEQADGSVALDAGAGSFFVEADDAETLANTMTRQGRQVELGTVQLASVLFALVLKQAKAAVFDETSLVGRTLSAGKAEQPFTLRGSAPELERARQLRAAADGPPFPPGTVPLFFAPALAFTDSTGSVVRPVFFRAQDAEATLNKRNVRGGGGAGVEPALAVADLTSELVAGLLAGSQPFPGFVTDTRALQLVPSPAAVDAAQRLAVEKFLQRTAQ